MHNKFAIIKMLNSVIVIINPSILISYYVLHKWALTWENLSSQFVLNKGTDQPAQSDQHLCYSFFLIVSYLNLLQANFQFSR